jgi:hypothetical protein
MQRTIRACIFFFLLSFSTSIFSQIAFFKSQQRFSENNLNKFYSSISIDDDLVLFIANDYILYAYSRSTGKELWVAEIGYKTARTCFVTEEFVFAPYYNDSQESTAMLNRKTGEMIRILPFGKLETKPILKGDVLYATAIYDGGAIFAYDVKKDSTLWWKFLAHGVSTQPYYFPEYIYANAEANNWVRINYKGQLLDTSCKEKADIFVKDIPCIKNFSALTHDGLELDEKFSEKLFRDNEAINPATMLTGNHNSFILSGDELVILGNKRKLQERINLSSLIKDTTEAGRTGLIQLIAAKPETIAFVYHDMLVTYDHAKRRVRQMIDLSAWQPSQVLPDENKVWLISQKDGLLYGLTF